MNPKPTRIRPLPESEWDDETRGLLENLRPAVPFMLSGGLDAGNVAEALRITRAPSVDVSSGVERAPGEKDPDKIRAFVRARLPADAKVEFKSFAGAPAIELPFDNPALVKTRAALAAEWGKKAIAIGEGGSIPIVGDFKRVLGMDTIMVGFALDDDRVHSPNEKFNISHFRIGIRAVARLLDRLAAGRAA